MAGNLFRARIAVISIVRAVRIWEEAGQNDSLTKNVLDSSFD